jgi:Arc/MetJ-type ribon-helix-helix transcriptional regulator
MPGRKKERMVLVSLHAPRQMLEWLDELVRRGRFPNRSEAIRYAIQRLYETYAHEQKTGETGPRRQLDWQDSRVG